jgi:hypothetical protein
MRCAGSQDRGHQDNGRRRAQHTSMSLREGAAAVSDAAVDNAARHSDTSPV